MTPVAWFFAVWLGGTVVLLGAAYLITAYGDPMVRRSRPTPLDAPVEPSPEDLDRIWLQILDGQPPAPLVTRPALAGVPRQSSRYLRVTPPLTKAQVDRVIAGMEPCGPTSIVGTCREHDHDACTAAASRGDETCCKSCPAAQKETRP